MFLLNSFFISISISIVIAAVVVVVVIADAGVAAVTTIFSVCLAIILLFNVRMIFDIVGGICVELSHEITLEFFSDFLPDFIN